MNTHDLTSENRHLPAMPGFAFILMISTGCVVVEDGSDDDAAAADTDAALDDGGTASSPGDESPDADDSTTGALDTGAPGDGGGSDGGVPAGCTVPDLSCPTELVELGTPGELAVQWEEFEWVYDAECMASVGPVVFAAIPEDVTGLGITIDAGPAFTALGGLEIDGRRWIDLQADGPTGLGQPPLKHNFSSRRQRRVPPEHADGGLSRMPGTVADRRRESRRRLRRGLLRHPSLRGRGRVVAQPRHRRRRQRVRS